MPDNDFYNYMMSAPQDQWGPAPVGAGWGRAQYWGGMQPQVPQASWSRTLGRYGGNAGGFAGGIMDSYMPMGGMGMYGYQPGAMSNPIRYSQHAVNQDTLDAAMRAAEATARTRVTRAIQSQGVTGITEEQTQWAMMLDPNLAGRLQGGSMTRNGVASLTGALATRSNGYKPLQSDVLGLQRGFEAYYGFDAQGNVRGDRTMGFSQDELADVVKETRRNMSRGDLAVERERARVEYTGLQDAAYKNAGTTREAFEAARARGGDAFKALNEKVSNAQTDLLRPLGMSELSQSSVQNKNLMAKSVEATAVYQMWKDAGAEGSISDINKKLETLSGEKMSPTKQRDLAERMRIVTEATGMTLDSVAAFMETIQKGANGINISTNRAGVITSLASMVGDPSLTGDQNAMLQGSLARGFAEPLKSPAALKAGLLMMSGDAKAKEDYKRLAASDPAAAMSFADSWAASSQDENVKGALWNIARGEYGAASATLQGMTEYGEALSAEYNDSKTSSERRKALESQIQAAGGTIKDGKAGMSDMLWESNRLAAAQAGREMEKYGIKDQMAGLGSGLMGGKGTAEQQMAMAATYSQSLLQTGNHESALRMAQEKARAMGIDVTLNNKGAGTMAMAGYVSQQARALDPSGVMLDVLGASALSKEQYSVYAEKQLRASRLQDMGKMSDSLRALASGEGSVKGYEALKNSLGASGLSGGWEKVMGAMLGQTGDQRAKSLDALNAAAAAAAEFSAVQDTGDDKKTAEARAALRGKVSAFAEATGLGKGADIDALMESLQNGGLRQFVAQSKAEQLKFPESFKIAGELTVRLVDEKGDIRKGVGTVEKGTATGGTDRTEGRGK